MTLIEQFKKDFYLNFIAEERWRYLATGLGNTLRITSLAVLMGIAIGIVVALIRTGCDRNRTELRGIPRFLLLSADALCRVYLAVIRGTPVVVQLMIMYYIIFSSSRNGVAVATLAFGINSGAYVAEIFRSGIQSVDPGQLEAGRALGFGYCAAMRHVVLPQAVRNVLPALANEFITLLKETSVAGYVTVRDLTMGGDIIRSVTYSPFLPLLAVALIYLIMVMLFTSLVGKLEKKLQNGVKRGA